MEHRNKKENRSDKLLPMNSDASHLPAAVTWFDACAYLKWLEDSYQIPVRLLKLEEYKTIREVCGYKGTVRPESSENEKLLEFTDEAGNSYDGNPPYMEEGNFQDLKCRYLREPDFINHPAGLQFVDSDYFCEWLFEYKTNNTALAVSSKSLMTARGGLDVDRGYFPADSTGKYHYRKIGFRICIEEA